MKDDDNECTLKTCNSPPRSDVQLNFPHDCVTLHCIYITALFSLLTSEGFPGRLNGDLPAQLPVKPRCDGGKHLDNVDTLVCGLVRAVAHAERINLRQDSQNSVSIMRRIETKNAPKRAQNM
jgi:hypothetical protein